MAQINLGRILPVFKGNWNSTVQYEKLDIVYYGGSSFVAKQASKGNAPGTTEGYEDDYWIIVSRGGTFDYLTEDQIYNLAIQISDVIADEESLVRGELGDNRYNL